MRWVSEDVAAATELSAGASRRVAHVVGWAALAWNVVAGIGYAMARDWPGTQWAAVAVVFCAVMQYGIALTAERHRTAETWARERLREEKADADMAEQRAGVMAAQRRFMEGLDPSKATMSVDTGLVMPGGPPAGGMKH